MTQNLHDRDQHLDHDHERSRILRWYAYSRLAPAQWSDACNDVEFTRSKNGGHTAPRGAVLLGAEAYAESFPAHFQVLLKSDLETLRGAPLPREFPKCLLARGETQMLARPTVAIVGSRAPTLYGRQMAALFANELAQSGVAVLSGGALGIDGIANKAAHAVGRSCAIVGGGLCEPHPRTHHPLFQTLATSGRGLLLSQFPENERARTWHFPQRNLTLALLSDFVLVIEASLKSGSLITARAAADAGVDLGALPGEIASPLSQGTNALIADGAFCIRRPSDILERLVTLRRLRSERQLFMGEVLTAPS
jgi:DNA protecting protein DprA